jgi:integrase
VDPAHTAAFLKQTHGNPLFALLHLVAYTGLRRGEACGLRWTDLDLDGKSGRGTLTVAQQVTQLGWATQAGQSDDGLDDRSEQHQN